MQMCIEAVDQAGGCSYGYSCVYTDTISWAAPNQPLPMIRDPRFAFDQLFGVGATPEERRQRRQEDRSILDSITGSASRLRNTLGATDRARLDDYLRKCAKSSSASRRSRHATTAASTRDLPGAPAGVPDSFSEHVKLMFDLQALAFAVDTTRVFSFKLGRDASSRAYPESGTKTGFHPASHHGEREDRILDFAKINNYHVSMVPYFLQKLPPRPTATARCSTTRSSSSARRWATRTCTTTSAARCSSPAMPAAV